MSVKKYISLLLIICLSFSLLVGCNSNTVDTPNEPIITPEKDEIVEVVRESVKIELSDSGIKVDTFDVSTDDNEAVYIANDIVYYEEGKDFTYGEGSENDAHSKEEADAHTVVHITQPGLYELSGTLSKGQIAIDLGEDSEEDPNAVVTLILNNIDITCSVAPAIIFYNVYECGNTDVESASKDVDTSNAGANVIIADNSVNTVNGSHVARIYKEGSVVLSEDGKSVEEAKKLHKYDGAFYSKMSMNVNGGEIGNGKLYINADNEGLDSELHLTLNGGNVNIISGNDGINTNEDNVSVTTINGGTLTIFVNGETGEGDGIDSNGWLVINGGTVIAQACGFSMDSGIDSDMGIHINGGTVIASGNMLDRISESNQNFAVFNFNTFLGKGEYTLKNSEGQHIITAIIENSCSSLIVSSSELVEGDYTLWYGGEQLVGVTSDNMQGMMGGMRPNGNMGRPNMNGEIPEGFTPPDVSEMPNGFNPNEMPDGFNPNNMTPPEGFDPNNMTNDKRPNNEKQKGDRPNGGMPNGQQLPNQPINMEQSEIFKIVNGANYFTSVGYPNFDIKISIAGDTMLASYKNQTTSGSFNEYVNEKSPEYFLEKVKPIFEADDFTIVNLENVFTDQNLKEVAKDHDPAYWYRSSTSNANILTVSSVEGVSLANNHFGDYGTSGRNDTMAAVDAVGLEYGTNDKTFYFEKNGFKIAVICHGLWGEWQADAIIDRIKEAESQSDFQIVYYHGGTERLHMPEDWKMRASRKLVDNGADLVIGNHPHVLQPMETYNGVEIVYSVGNFCFGGSKRPENRTIIYQMTLTVSKDGVVLNKTSEIIPCYVYTGDVNNYQPAPIEDEVVKQKVLDFMNWMLDTPV